MYMKQKFNIGDKVFLLEHNKVVESYIFSVYLHTEGTQNKWFNYALCSSLGQNTLRHFGLKRIIFI